MKQSREEILNGQLVRRPADSIFRGRYFLKCQLCGSEKPVRPLPSGRKRRFRKLSLLLNTCTLCGGLVCDDCFIISDGTKMIEGICRACAEKLGIRGKTTSEILGADGKTI